MPKITFFIKGHFFSYPFTVTKRGCKESYILRLSCEIRITLDRKQIISVRKTILHNFHKKSFNIFFHFRNISFSELRPTKSLKYYI